MTDTGGQPRKLPYVEHFDAYNRRVIGVVRSAETVQLEKEIFGQGLFSSKITPWESMAKRYLLHQLGEFGVMCPIACTEGLVALIRHFPEGLSPAVDSVLKHCTDGVNGEFGIGAQFVSEIQGGSEIPANLLEALPVRGPLSAARHQIFHFGRSRRLCRGHGQSLGPRRGRRLHRSNLAAGQQGQRNPQ